MLVALLGPLSFLPTLLVVCVVFSFSTRPNRISNGLDCGVDCRVVRAGDRLLSRGLDDRRVTCGTSKVRCCIEGTTRVARCFLLTVTVSFPLCICNIEKV